MSSRSEAQEHSFIDLIAYTKINVGQHRVRGNVIKSSEVLSAGSHVVEVESGDEAKPSFLIHRNGGIIEKVEFICSCGKTTVLSFDYADE